ncbi:MAG TPA: molybdopterin-synthase adenylyltransferase MoeB, partial [Gammaproteobacteria bacterium]|nr:molybdopterin-synthase adenylyltransferase MoeB [Gammaproteobacteria bacterium]
MNPQEQERYSRQIKLPQVGNDGQQRLLDAQALIIGMGGLGSPVALYLASAGIGRLTITDFDRVDESNLQRQVIHTQEMIGELKAESARDAIEQLNPDCMVEALDYELDGEDLLERV